MPVTEDRAAAVTTSVDAGELGIALRGEWRLREERPGWRWPEGVQAVRLDARAVSSWDTALVLWIAARRREAEERGIRWVDTLASVELQARLAQQAQAQARPTEGVARPDPLTQLGLATHGAMAQARAMTSFLGEVVIGGVATARDPRRFRAADCLFQMQLCGANALPIVSLISFLVGVTLAYTGALILRQYGGDIYVADLVGLSMVREMGAMMTAVVLAGRTGAAFAAELANMKANEEVDAFVTFGFRPFDFLVLPRMLALALMLPMLALYANLLGILGGMIIALAILDIPPTAYFVEMATTVGVMDIATGLIKAATFGLLVGLAGCFHGLRAEPNAAGVGRAATSAVVTGILLVIVADAVYAVIFNAVGW